MNTILLDSQGSPPIGALWSVGTEFQFYLMSPFLVILLRPLLTSGRRIAIASLAVALLFTGYKYAVTSGHGLTHWHSFVYMPVLPNLDLFLYGVFSAFAVEWLKSRSVSIDYGLQIGCGALLMLYAVTAAISSPVMVGGRPEDQELFSCFLPVATSLCSAGIIVVFELRRAGQPQSSNSVAAAAWWLAAQGGTLTYSLYVWSEPVMLSLRKIAPAAAQLQISDSLLYLAGMGIPLLLLIAVLFHRAIEVPFDRMRGKLA